VKPTGTLHEAWRQGRPVYTLGRLSPSSYLAARSIPLHWDEELGLVAIRIGLCSRFAQNDASQHSFLPPSLLLCVPVCSTARTAR